MAVKKSELYTLLWSSCDEPRGGTDASQYKDHVLILLFIKYVIDRFKGDPDAQIEIPEKGDSFDDLVEVKGRPDIGDRINKVIRKLADEDIKNSFVVILKLERTIDNKKVIKSTTRFYIFISYQRNQPPIDTEFLTSSLRTLTANRTQRFSVLISNHSDALPPFIIDAEGLNISKSLCII